MSKSPYLGQDVEEGIAQQSATATRQWAAWEVVPQRTGQPCNTGQQAADQHRNAVTAMLGDPNPAHEPAQTQR